MKALTIYQPWAELLAVGAKTFETRSWSTSYRGPIALHASARRLPPYAYGELRALLREWRISEETIAYGCVIAYATLLNVYPSDCVRLTARERVLGDFSDGRYAWHLRVERILDEPIPCKGARLLWDFTTPAQGA